MLYLGVDTGGTFTDFVLLESGKLRVHKVLSTPEAPEKAILQGIDALGLSGKPLTVIHGSTVATNAVLEGKGVKTAFITNKGFKDLLTIGRQARRELYNLQPEQTVPPVEAELCLDVDCRLSADGEWLSVLNPEKLEKLVGQVQSLDVQAIAVNLLFSYLDDSAELAIAHALPENLFISISSQVLSEIGEYERGMATWLNAWVGPLIQGYINRLQSGLSQKHSDFRLAVMQSSGETMDAAQAASQAVRMLLSGPAGGLVGARFMGQAVNRSQLMTFDMGGTSSDVALIDGRLQLTNQGRIAGYPVSVPMVDMHTIGAGGGSIAILDEGGMLQVGPQSAGASPGPACYGQGGSQPTVTDANLVLGRIPADSLFGGYLKLDMDAAQRAISSLADEMGVGSTVAAEGIIDIANEHMARALRVISVQKGYDPTEFALVSFGGAGGLHVCELAEKLDMTDVIVPVHAGVLSALGMLATRPGRQLSQSMICLLDAVDTTELKNAFHVLQRKAQQALLDEGVDAEHLQSEFSIDVRYRGQSNTLNIPWHDKQTCMSAFHKQHEKRFGHRLDFPVELVNVRVGVIAEGIDRGIQLSVGEADHSEIKHDKTDSMNDDVAVYQRSTLQPGQQLDGPAIIAEPVATTWLAEGWHCRCEKDGNLILWR